VHEEAHSLIVRKIIKGILKVLPFKKQLFLLLKKIWVPPHAVYKHLYFNGTFRVKTGENNYFKIRHYEMEIENDIFWKGLTEGWEKQTMKLWIKLCSQAKVVFDIGANTGVYALCTKSLNKEAKVFAFEPLKQMYKKLAENNVLNQFDVVCIEKALSDKTGTATIYETGTDHVAAASLNAENKAYGVLNVETEISTITLDDFIEQNNIQSLDLIKLDVETFEPQVIEGFKKYLPILKPVFLIEVLSDEVGARLQTLFQGLGYLYFNIDDRNDKIRRVDKITKSDYFNFLFCSEKKAKELQLIS
jgi:FkbM family methyltransferase